MNVVSALRRSFRRSSSAKRGNKGEAAEEHVGKAEPEVEVEEAGVVRQERKKEERRKEEAMAKKEQALAKKEEATGKKEAMAKKQEDAMAKKQEATAKKKEAATGRKEEAMAKRKSEVKNAVRRIEVTELKRNRKMQQSGFSVGNRRGLVAANGVGDVRRSGSSSKEEEADKDKEEEEEDDPRSPLDPSAPVPAPRQAGSSKQLQRDDHSFNLSVDEDLARDLSDDLEPKTPSRMTPATDDQESPPFDSLETANLARDAKVGKAKTAGEDEEEEPKIFINNAGEWVVDDLHMPSTNVDDDDEDLDLQGRQFLKDLSELAAPAVQPLGSSFEEDDASSKGNEQDYEDDIPEDWKENEAIPMRRCIPAQDEETPEEEEEEDSPGLMSVIEEVEEEEREESRRASFAGLAGAPRVTNVDDFERSIGQQQQQQRVDAALQQQQQQQHAKAPPTMMPLQKRLSREERVSPDTVTSNDSGVVVEDPHDELFSPSGFSVRNIAKFWEDVTHKEEEQQQHLQHLQQAKEEEDFSSLSKKWNSMPDLKDKKKRESSPPLLQTLAEDINDDDYSASNRQQEPAVVRCNEDVDDRDVCALVPIRERMRMFETLAAHAQMEKKKQWFSMPSLDPPKKNRDNYARYPSSYGRQESQNQHHYNPLKSVMLQPSQEEEKAQETKRKMSSPQISTSITAERPIPLVSSSSKDSEDFELTPLRDRMRAFQGSGGPVTKPVVSAIKTVSPNSKSAPASNSRKSATLPPSSNPYPSYHHNQHSVETSTSPSYSARNTQTLDDETSSLTDSVADSVTESVASSHTSSSTVISASKINSYNVNNGFHSSVIPTYSWNDESNGEIYNDKPEQTDSVLYVVENGKEFPLTSVSKRKSLFQSPDSFDVSTLSKISRDIHKSEPMILVSGGGGQQKKYECSSGSSVSSSGSSDEDMVDEFDRIVRDNDVETVEKQKETIKSANVPYIKEEQEILAKINVVRAMKERFLVNGS